MIRYQDDDDIAPIIRTKKAKTARQIEAARENLAKRISKGGRPRKNAKQTEDTEEEYSDDIVGKLKAEKKPKVKVATSDWLQQWLDKNNSDEDNPPEKQIEKPVEKPIEKPVEKPIEKPVVSLDSDDLKKVLSRLDDLAPHILKTTKYTDRLYHYKKSKPPKIKQEKGLVNLSKLRL